MTKSLRRWSVLVAILPAATWAATPMTTPPSALTLSIDGLRSTRGMVRICLTRTPVHFPDCSGDADSRSLSVPAGQAGDVSIDGVAAGDYAVAVIHDENANQRLDTFVGIPREGIGFSRNPAIRFGAPSFRSAEFTVGNASDAPMRQRIHMHYFL